MSASVVETVSTRIVEPGASAPLGASIVAGGVNFSVFSRDATLIERLLFDDETATEPARTFPLEAKGHRTYHYWHAFVPGLEPGQVYGYRAHGPFAPKRGLRFNARKVLLDPYGLAITVPGGYDRGAARRPGGNAAVAMKSVVLDRPDWADHSHALAFTLRSLGERFLLHGMLNAYWARALAPLLARATFSLVLTSPLGRARQTCALAGLAARAEVDTNLMEWGYGEYEGLTSEQIRARAPGWMLFSDGCPGGERPSQVGARVDQVIARIRSVEGDVALFAHGHVFRVFAARWLGLPPSAGSHFLLDTATVSVLSHYGGIPAVKRWNAPLMP